MAGPLSRQLTGLGHRIELVRFLLRRDLNHRLHFFQHLIPQMAFDLMPAGQGFLCWHFGFVEVAGHFDFPAISCLERAAAGEVWVRTP